MKILQYILLYGIIHGKHLVLLESYQNQLESFPAKTYRSG